ncbi:putative reverse transcriptase domain-containing protein [Tanacetum coccineum]
MAPKRSTRTTPVTTAPATTTTVTNAQLQAMIDQIDQGVTDALAAMYNQLFQELALLCVRKFPEEVRQKLKVPLLKDKLKTRGSLKTLPETIRINNNKIRGKTPAGHTLLDRVIRNNMGGSRPLCSKCNYHHDGLCAPKCYKCNKFGHIARDCRSAGNANNTNNQKGTGSGQRPTCFECRVQGHFKKECPKLKNNKGNRGNQDGKDTAPAKVYAVGRAGTNPDSNVMSGMFLLNNRYASVLFDTGADKSFMSTAFSSQMDIMPSTLDHYYDVELADERIIRLNTILRGCTLNLLNYPFNINLMPVELGSFDAIIGMDWLAKYQAIIVCAEKIVRIPWGNETLIIHGGESNQGHETYLHIISYSKTQEYMLKGCSSPFGTRHYNGFEDQSRISDLRMF